jgi:hypothetical protein
MSDSPRNPARSGADLVFESFYSGAIGGSVVALFFLAVDAWQGRPLFTPSLMGSVLFTGDSAASLSDVRLDMVAYYSVVHFAVFGAIGTGLTLLVHQVEVRSRQPWLGLLGLFAALELGFFAAAALLMPGIVVQLGVVPIGAANLLAAGSMGLFLLAARRPEAWDRLKHAAHLA